MNKQSFLKELEKCLSGISEDEKNKTLDYYREMIEDAAEDGRTEEDIIAGFDSPKIIASKLADESGSNKSSHEKTSKKKISVLTIILIIMASPIWLPVAAGAASIIISFYVGLWSIAISFFAVFAGLAAGGIGLLGASPFVLGADPVKALMFFGTSLTCMGASVFIWVFSVWFAKKLIKLTAYCGKTIKTKFTKKGRDQ